MKEMCRPRKEDMASQNLGFNNAAAWKDAHTPSQQISMAAAEES